MMTPTSAIGVLAASKQEERATVMSALILWRCLGHVVGVAGSEMVVQNALLRFLKQSVTGPNRDQVRTPTHSVVVYGYYTDVDRSFGKQGHRYVGSSI